jgi:hypothetical protein
MGLPDRLQMENDATFRGDYKAPRVLGDVVDHV